MSLTKKDVSSGKSEKTSTNGEALQECTDTEWDSSDEPYSAELLNVKKKPNRVNVFSATEKPNETIVVTEEVSPPGTPFTAASAPPAEHHSLARLIQKTCETLLKPTTADGTEIRVRLELPDWRD